jgi:DNA helicase-2/ATP-dependent DNA helicase PcrA
VRGTVDASVRAAASEPADEALFIVAGPGTGKTTCLTLRILKLVLVDGVNPSRIVATTFTVKAAAELRSRVLGWGFRIVQALEADSSLPVETQTRLASLDINQVFTGTVDSLCEKVLRDWRPPGTQPPIVADEFVTSTLMLHHGLFANGRFQSTSLGALLGRLMGNARLNVPAKTIALSAIADRREHDRIDWRRYMRKANKEKVRLDEALNGYDDVLRSRGLVDFGRLEALALNGISSGEFAGFLESIDALIVDEYQDTNLLQQQLYFAIAEGCSGALTVVGDDDQSLYRFRGATVELFRDYENEYRQVFDRTPRKHFLSVNHRSTVEIVDFVNTYAELDAGYQHARVAGKPRLTSSRARSGVPVLAMFRPDRATLAHDLAGFLHAVFRGSGARLPSGDVLEAARTGGDVGDCAVLCGSPREYSSGGTPRLPYLLRQELRALQEPIGVFNPRGEELADEQRVALVGGLLLEALDQGAVIEGRTSGVWAASRQFTEWRAAAVAYLRTAPRELRALIQAWRSRADRAKKSSWPRSVPVLDLLYGIVHFFPEIHDDAEGQLALEVFTRQLSASDLVGGFRGRVLTDPSAQADAHGVTLPERSVMELLRSFLAPIAAGVVKINEDLVDSFPRDRVSILSIHQAKGLEFPLVIVDVASDFGTNNHLQAFKRFPRDAGPPQRMEDEFRAVSPLGRPKRSQLDRVFDDLYRQYFVAFSRAQDALMLVGVDASRPGGRIQNVATGWDRDGVSQWGQTPPYAEF